jgi:hypothetical protein
LRARIGSPAGVSLRARLGLAAGIAVAIAVFAVAVSAYAGTRSQLRGQVDTALRQLRGDVLHRPHPPGADGRGFGFQGGPPAEAPGEGDEGLGLDRRRGPGFGGPAGIVSLVYKDGGTYMPPGQTERIPPNGRMTALAAKGQGEYLTDMHSGSTHIRVLVTGIGENGALAVALPLTDVDKTLSDQLLLLVVIAAGGVALAALLGLAAGVAGAAAVVFGVYVYLAI